MFLYPIFYNGQVGLVNWVIRDNQGVNPIGGGGSCIDSSNNIAPWGTTSCSVYSNIVRKSYLYPSERKTQLGP